MSKATIVLQIHKDLVAGNLILPALPKVALKVKEVVSSSEATFADIEAIVKSDPAFAAHLIGIANSAMYKTLMPVQNITDAISRIGLKSLKDISISYSVKAMFNIRNKKINAYLQQIWFQTTYTAALAYVMAKRSKQFQPEQAMLAGLLQNIGTLPLLQKATQYNELVQDPAGVKALIDKYAASLGAAMIRSWKLEQAFQDVARHRGDWFRHHDGLPDLTDLLTLARLHSFVGTKTMRELPRINEIPAFFRLDLGDIGPEQSLAFIEQAKSDIQSLQQSLAKFH